MSKNLLLISKGFLLEIYNRMWNERNISEEWKSSLVLPILKLDKTTVFFNFDKPLTQ